MKLSPDGAVWTCEPVDVAALLPVPSRWQRDDGADSTCWQFDGERWLVNVCGAEPVDPLDVPELVRQLLPGACYVIGVGIEGAVSDAGWAFLNRVITALATGSHGLGFDVHTGQPIR